MQYPKILIIGQSFNKKSGGGVTISNLFTSWPKDRLAVASNANLLSGLDTSVCNTYFQLGYNNKLHPFPLNLILPKIKCGLLQVNETQSQNTAATAAASGKYKFIYNMLLALLNFFGVYNLFYKLKITKEFKQWLAAYNPDVIYTQLASLELIRFVSDVKDFTKKPVAIHMMDDWPLTIIKPGLLYMYWQNVIDREFRKLLNKTELFLTISDTMADEYENRYGKKSLPFHNPIDIGFWKPHTTKDYSATDSFSILYAGRIGFGIAQSIADIAAAVNQVSKTNKKLLFQIQTADVEELKKLVTFSDYVKWVQPVAYNQLPQKFSDADLLLLPQDFDKKSVRFLKFSFPTKVSEYMISGTPILVYGDERTGLTKYALKENWAYVVTNNNSTSLVNAINELIANEALRKSLAQTAQNIALQREDAGIVRENFRKTFIAVQ